ncbi:MAG: hypothetical protein CMH33_04155 [Microbacterium sp.]|nr:hypothetical protein [Microbacterium sp.]
MPLHAGRRTADANANTDTDTDTDTDADADADADADTEADATQIPKRTRRRRRMPSRPPQGPTPVRPHVTDTNAGRHRGRRSADGPGAN